MYRAIASAALLFLASVVFAADDIPDRLPPEQEAAAIALAERTGKAIYDHDHAAAAATDALLAHAAAQSDQRVRGWVTERVADGIAVTFVDDTPAALYRVMVDKNGAAGPVHSLPNPAPLTAYEMGAALARSAAVNATYEPCAQHYNAVVLPAGGTGTNEWAVYLLPATTQKGVVPFGGTYRLDVADAKVVAQRGFTRTCIALQSPPQAAGLMITHLLDAIPTEVHVFWSLWAGKPMYVATPPHGNIWLIDKGKIKLVERKSEG